MAFWHYLINSPPFFRLSKYVGFARVIFPDSHSKVYKFLLIWFRMKLMLRVVLVVANLIVPMSTCANSHPQDYWKTVKYVGFGQLFAVFSKKNHGRGNLPQSKLSPWDWPLSNHPEHMLYSYPLIWAKIEVRVDNSIKTYIFAQTKKGEGLIMMCHNCIRELDRMFLPFDLGYIYNY